MSSCAGKYCSHCDAPTNGDGIYVGDDAVRAPVAGPSEAAMAALRGEPLQ